MPKAKQALCLLLALVLAMAFFACAPAGGAAAPDEAVTIRLAAPQNGNILDFETNAYKLWLEEQTGLKLEMTWLPQEDALCSHLWFSSCMSFGPHSKRPRRKML